ncbi:MAG: hypothetical protein GX458_01790 [Phyllobacteriaceae bacterium]|nr:hypothetical protein [Phyllobacteriaceae bacterium]
MRVDASLLRFVLLHRKYNPDQPRIPAGESGGGRWTDGGGSGGGDRVRLAQNGPTRLPRSTVTTRLGARPLEGTPGQLTEWAITDAQAQAAVASVRRIDPRWRPPESLTETIEGEIEAAKGTLEAARSRLAELGDPRAQEERLGVCIRPGGEWVGEQVATSKETTRTVSREDFRDLV